jgi:hypothetical protein
MAPDRTTGVTHPTRWRPASRRLEFQEGAAAGPFLVQPPAGSWAPVTHAGCMVGPDPFVLQTFVDGACCGTAGA